MNIKNLFGDSRTVKKLEKIANEIDNLDAEMQELSDSELKNKTNEFKKRIRGGESLEQIQVEAFAVCREAAVRSLGMKPYKVQLIGGLCLHQGKIAEMKTGEGKTLVAALPAYLNALTGNGVHVVTVNDYLAKRDAEQMGKLYNFLGLSVGCITNDIDGYDRRAQYMADITYGTNNEFGFDYLRDNMSTEKSELIQRELNYAIVDEVDSILIDEARTPLIISGMGDNSSYLYKDADMFVKSLDKDDYIIEEKDKQIALSETGIKKCENRFNIDNFADPENLELNHYVNAALKANYIMTRDIDYIVSDDEILIVDEFTGRIMYGRRFSNGLHQAIEAKEGIKVKAESQTLATITLQNYFRMYNKLSGMTGTAKTEEEEFREIYNLPVLPIPTNKPVIRDDRTDIVFAHQKDKYNAIVEKIIEVHETGQPVLVGTVSIEISELLSKMLKKRGVKHNVLNAKNHEKEAEIIAEAGKFGAITIATNMAGRGTDILLGGNPEFEAKKEMKKLEYTPEQISFATGFTETDNDELKKARKVYRDYLEKFKKARESEQEEVKNLGGLFIIGTERHESRRVDNQLRGRAGRQGDPGTSQFFVSMEDDLARLFGGERSQKIIKDAGLDDEPLDGKMITKILESAQKKVEGKNFGIRKYVLQYDDVMNQQREIIYGQRRDVLEGKDISASVMGMAYEIIDNAVDLMTSESKYPEEWDYEKLFKNLNKLSPKFRQYVNLDNISSRNDIESELYEAANKIYKEKEEEITEDVMRHVERIILLRVVDAHWMEHIDAMDQLKEGIGLRGIGQQDPAQAYSKEGFAMFDNMIKDIRGEVAKFCFNITVTTQVAPVEIKEESQPFIFNGDNEPKKKIGRNDACPCGSGKKYKNCCGLNK